MEFTNRSTKMITCTIDETDIGDVFGVVFSGEEKFCIRVGLIEEAPDLNAVDLNTGEHLIIPAETVLYPLVDLTLFYSRETA